MMNDRKTSIERKLIELQNELDSKITEWQNIKEELENFLSQFTCVLDAPSCGCSEEELNDPKFDALYTEQYRLTKLSKALSREVNVIKANITALEEELKTMN